MSPTQRTLRLLRDHGYVAQVVERWNPFAKVRQDLFGFIDIVAMRSGSLIGVQATTTSNVMARITKIFNDQRSGMWLSTGASLLVVGWSKRKSGWKPVVKKIDSGSAATEKNCVHSDVTEEWLLK